ncbi:OPT oligopeptide transporter protein-domain-containing protein [Roridomyces roridus]|uniref:OPT oligopeptide transporter protein-domain-containing protein n=1 Tax=Roridomyces roridus TaxID=1738132 RepID=A0AAD7C5R9_9AGAR|nr:OPT oligopeptide transporter protein-domain-containing protein [Roridomyces roridus]
MEDDLKPYLTSNEALPQYVRRRTVPDVPEDVDYVMEHLNDPNLDLKKPLAKAISLESISTRAGRPVDAKSSAYSPSEFDSSDRYSAPSRAESRESTVVEFDDESPYPEVRAAVSSVDDPLMPVNTFRMWFLGILLTVLLAGINQVFEYRAPSVFITSIVAQLISLPMGKFLEWTLPSRQFKTLNYVWSLNPGPFNIKEHVCITTMANIAYVGAYATDVLATQQMYFKQQIPWSYQILLVLGTQFVGFSLGGMLRPYVVWPSSMIWPSALVNSALFNTLHKNYGKRDRGHMPRERFFLIVCACSFAWYWVPGYLFTALSFFSWITWIAPTNVTVNALFGSLSGLGMSVVTFDWAQISFIGSPLVVPWWATMNIMASVVICFWFIVPILYFKNAFYTAFLPISAFNTFDNTGMPYNISAVFDSNGNFSEDLYVTYSPMFLSSTMCMGYFVAFATAGAIFTHTGLWFGRDLVRRFRSGLKDERDVHSRLMMRYAEVPGWWYAAVAVISTLFIFVAIEIFPTQLPIWAAALALFLGVLFAVPLSMLQAIANSHVALQVVEELIAGYALPGKPVANIIFKAIAYNSTAQSITFAGDLKLGHYMKIPPRTMFNIQMVSTLITAFVVTGTQTWMFSHVAGICTPEAVNSFVCPSNDEFAAAGVMFGAIGPQRIFSQSGMYNPLLWGLLVGVILPVPFYFLARRFPLSYWRYVNIPVFFGGVAAIPAAGPYNYAAWALTGFIFNFVIRRRHFRWWMRYNYILSAGLDAGVAFCLIIMFFSVQYSNGGVTLNWWGNTVWQNTADAMGTPLLIANGTFGPKVWA